MRLATSAVIGSATGSVIGSAIGSVIGSAAPMRPTLPRSATPVLPRWIEDARALEPASDGARACHERLPDGRTALVFRVLEERRRGDVAVAGPRTRALFKSTRGVARAVILQLEPGWAAQLFGVAASALADRTVLLDELWGPAAAKLCAELLAAPHPAAAVEHLARALTRRLLEHGARGEPAAARLARRAARLLEGEEPRVERVAAALGVTARHLRRAFTESIGIAPKDYARSVRLQRAVRLSAAAAPAARDWARIASAAGYYDQSHLLAEFRDLVGLTPGAFVAQRASGALAEPAPAQNPRARSRALPVDRR